MKILILCSKNSGRIAPFITDQVEALQKAGVVCEYFTVEGKGMKGYLWNFIPMMRKIREFQPDIIHAHYGLSGLLANLQRKVPVVTTYHGSDINNPKVLRYSKVSIILSAWNIFVSDKNIQLAGVKGKFSLIPCGVDTDIFRPMERNSLRKKLNFRDSDHIVLFAGAFDNPVKNPELAKEAVAKVPGARLMEMKGYSRVQVAELMNAADVCLMTSHSEGSPQFIKEAMACGCPIVSVDVGDVAEILEGVEGCRIADKNATDVAQKIEQVLIENKRTNGREKLIKMRLDSESVAQKIISIYNEVLA
ncbi:MAG: glycosyltransferase [Bacteroidia bacterium]|nr:glycosyltransferase [Bacteroidia bacterium]